MTRVALISDTHGRIDDSFDKYLKECDLILHAGDYGDWSVIDKLQKFAPVKVVSGRKNRTSSFVAIAIFCVLSMIKIWICLR